MTMGFLQYFQGLFNDLTAMLWGYRFDLLQGLIFNIPLCLFAVPIIILRSDRKKAWIVYAIAVAVQLILIAAATLANLSQSEFSWYASVLILFFLGDAIQNSDVKKETESK